MPTKITAKQIDEIIELKKEGYSDKEVAEKVGCSTTSVSKYKYAALSLAAEKEKGKESIVKREKKNVIDSLAEGETFNLLDLAKDEQDLADIGAGAGIFLGSIGDDIVSMFDKNEPIQRRIAKGIRTGSTISATLASAYEAYRQLRSKKEK